VAIKGGSLPKTMMDPFIKEPRIPVNMEMIYAIKNPNASELHKNGNVFIRKGESSFIPITANTPLKANKEPTDKSIPPLTMTNVIPNAIIPLYDT